MARNHSLSAHRLVGFMMLTMVGLSACGSSARSGSQRATSSIPTGGSSTPTTAAVRSASASSTGLAEGVALPADPCAPVLKALTGLGWTVTKTEKAYGPGGADTRCNFDGNGGTDGGFQNGAIEWLPTLDTIISSERGTPVTGLSVTAWKEVHESDAIIVGSDRPFTVFLAHGADKLVQLAAELLKG
jgi:hypothetical protein